MAVGRKALGVLLALCPSSFALNPALDINQYAHTAWTIRDGFFNSPINTIAQTRDGYLWLGTNLGLLRFDGVRFVPWQPPGGEHLPGSNINQLLASRDGRLWIGTDKGLASWKAASLTRYAQFDAQDVRGLVQDREGAVWVGLFKLTGNLCRFQNAAIQCFGEDGSFGNAVSLLYEDSRGNLWVAAQTGLWRWKPGPPKRYPILGFHALVEDENGTLVIGTTGGLRKFAEERVEPYSPAEFRQASPLLRDRDGSLWIGTFDHGLWHLHHGRADHYSTADGLSGDRVMNLFEDHENNIWVATTEGLDRFREFAAPTISVKQGLSNAVVWSVLAARDGSIWLGTPDGLNRWNRGQASVYRKRNGLPGDSAQSLFQDDRGQIWVSVPGAIGWFEDGDVVRTGSLPEGYVYSITGTGRGEYWISHTQGLLHFVDDTPGEPIPWAALGSKTLASALHADSHNNGLWVGFPRGGVVYFKDGRVRASYSSRDGLGEGRVGGFRLDPDGTLWVATAGGLSRIKDGHVATLTSNHGLPCDLADGVVEGDDHSFWLNMACGLVRIARPELDLWAGGSKRVIQATVFDASDGVRGHANNSTFSPRLVKSNDGRLWFLTGAGVSVIDPRHIPVNKLPPPVHIEKIVADRKTYWQNFSGAAASNLRLPALSRDLQIDYTALSFVAPEKVRFRYKLEGHDSEWTDADTRRQAFYNDLAPRRYRFRVMASNNSGVWNEAGDALEFSIAPKYYQTTWFWSSIAAAVLASLVMLYRLRLRYLKHQFNVRLEARVGERTRIARDLHDTLLQSFQGVLLKFSTVKYMMRDRPDEAEATLERYIDQARAAITEGRDAVQGLRSSTVVANDLARAISSFGQGLAADQTGPNRPEFRVYVEGKSRNLPPLVRDEVYKIACECLRNAFRHAQARRIGVQIRYDPRQFRLQLVDNGKGIDQAVLSAGGRAGHHGLPGLHERAELAGGKLSVWSQPGSGTEIELTIPAALAYAKSKTPPQSPVARPPVPPGVETAGATGADSAGATNI